MNNSKSRVIALLLVIPLLLIFVMTSVVETTQIIVDIPVSSLTIVNAEGEEITKEVVIDLANQDNSYQINTVIAPQNASIKNVTYAYSKDESQASAIVDEKTGKVVALGLGSVTVNAYAGDKSAKIKLNYIMSAVNSVTKNPDIGTIELEKGKTLNMMDYFSTNEIVTGQTWASDNGAIASVDANSGIVVGKSAGQTTVRGEIAGKKLDSTTGKVSDFNYKIDFDVKVNYKTDAVTGFTFEDDTPDGVVKLINPEFDGNSTTLNFTVEESKLAEYGTLTPKYDTQYIDNAKITQKTDGTFVLDVKLGDNAKPDVPYAIDIHSTNKLSKQPSGRRNAPTQTDDSSTLITTVYVQKGYLSYVELKANTTALQIGNTYQPFITYNSDVFEGYEDFLEVTYTSSDESVLFINSATKKYEAKGEGTVTITAKVTFRGEEVKVPSKSIEIKIVNPLTNISFDENSANHGLENRKTIADHDVVFDKEFYNEQTKAYNYLFYTDNYNLLEKNYALELSATPTKGDERQADENIEWKSSDETIATVSDGKVKINGNGLVAITATYDYKHLGLNVNKQLEATITLRCLKNSLWVDDYYDLMFAMDVAKKSTDKNLTNKTPIVDAVVLRSDVMLAPVLENNSFKDYRNYLSNFATKTMATTMDATYYQDIGRPDEATIRYCVDVNKNIYGNGKYICGEYISNSNARLVYTIFEGPLDLVSTTENKQNAEKASVKAQDNVVFMVNTPNVTICNVELKGCADETLYGGEEGGEANLANFNNVGTVLEVVEDGCQLTYSRVKNGRTVVRIFGKAYSSELDPQKRTPIQQVAYIQERIKDFRTTTTISNCILSHGREFILKISSNQIIKNVDAKTKGDSERPYTDSELNNITNLASPFLCGDTINGKHNLCKSGSHNYYKSAGEYKATQESYTDIGGMYTGQSQYKQEVDNFYNNYVLTDVILRDSAFSDSGLFCIGFESRFAGSLLFSKNDLFDKFFDLTGWNRVAGTSMPSRLKMEGNVRFYDWKLLDNVNAESLIEVSEKFTYREYLNLNIQKMVEDYQSGMLAKEKDTFVNLLDFSDGANYINGSTAFYGGGKNYSYIDASEVNSDFVPLSEYRVSMNYFPRTEFITAAGKEPFRFYMYNSQSTLNRYEQEQLIKNNQAYSWLYRTNK